MDRIQSALSKIIQLVLYTSNVILAGIYIIHFTAYKTVYSTTWKTLCNFALQSTADAVNKLRNCIKFLILLNTNHQCCNTKMKLNFSLKIAMTGGLHKLEARVDDRNRKMEREFADGNSSGFGSRLGYFSAAQQLHDSGDRGKTCGLQ